MEIFNGIEVSHPRKFILAGKAEFSIQNLKSGVKYSYKVFRAKDSGNLYFVYVSGGEAKSGYAGFLSCQNGAYTYSQGKKGTLPSNSPAVAGLMYALSHGVTPLKRPMVMYHHGKCALCGRKLKDAESIVRGFGPDCWKKMCNSI